MSCITFLQDINLIQTNRWSVSGDVIGNDFDRLESGYISYKANMISLVE